MEMKAFYKKYSPIGLALACMFIAYLAYDRGQYRDQLYMVTPSIPFQPFCDEGGNHGDIRPIKGAVVSEAFRQEALKALSFLGVTVRLQNMVWKGSKYQPNPTPVLLSPESFNDSSSMIYATMKAMQEIHGFPFDAPTLLCKDVEGIIKKF